MTQDIYGEFPPEIEETGKRDLTLWEYRFYNYSVIAAVVAICGGSWYAIWLLASFIAKMFSS